MSQSGVTLMELVVVLAILAMLAGVAVRGLGEAGMRGRVEATRRTLEVVREGVLGVEERNGGGGGFLADMGRLPRLGEWTDGDGAGWLGFRDLVDGSGMAAHGMYPALGSNVVARFVGEWDGTNASVVASEAVWVKAGWRGPYVVGRGADGMPLDGWGRLMAARPGGGGPCWMLIWQTNGLPLSGTAPWPIGHGIASGVGLPLSGVVCDAGAEAGGGFGAVREWVTWGRHEVVADPVVVQVRDVAGRWA
ncbi:MAG: type II secretion system protein, partial [Verrucomicrobiota bacterium]